MLLPYPVIRLPAAVLLIVTMTQVMDLIPILLVECLESLGLPPSRLRLPCRVLLRRPKASLSSIVRNNAFEAWSWERDWIGNAPMY